MKQTNQKIQIFHGIPPTECQQHAVHKIYYSIVETYETWHTRNRKYIIYVIPHNNTRSILVTAKGLKPTTP